ncbi:MAG: bifunctional (p)ppGpp synthetase/guanosine-3',5'-bis(diphosphate) 3'-pyrophosphohydrolase [Bacteroidales bacterium]|nr:bifunctional (p)ppGpp synthetase/guanosine-3',5'-bis(diphosphate) 3'-pyrophosphohydrolase [Bacteroidales bacterium]
MSKITAEERKIIEVEYDNIISLCMRCRGKENATLIKKAFDLSCKAHEKMRRRSGEPYVIHPIAVAKIVADEIGLGTKSVISALLHDVVEDTDYTVEDIRELFGDKIASIVDGLTKISHVLDKDASLQAENFRKMLLTISEDIRVVYIKLADRLHNMRTLDSMPEYKQMKISGETLYLYAPLAHRLGLYAIKTELEDLALKYEHPLIYHEVEKKLKNTEEERNEYIESFVKPLQEKLERNKIVSTITGRPKSIYSIWNKMHNKNVPFEEIYDVFAVRIVFNPGDDASEKEYCWKIFSLITDLYLPRENRIRDWVTTPKANGYEALHVTVMGPKGRWVEVQIRSQRMDEIAEKGYAAHWKYKNGEASENQLDAWLEAVKEQLKSSSSDALDFLDEFKTSLFASEIYVFTPKGKLIRVPVGATAIDFAYQIHTDIGNTAIAAKINYQLQPLSYELRSGDQVEIITSQQQSPKREWLTYAITSKAKSKIKAALKETRRYNVNKGQEMFIEKVRELGIQLDHETFKKLRENYDVSNKEEFYRRIGQGVITLDDLEKHLINRERSTFMRFLRLKLIKTKDEENKTQKGQKLLDIDESQLEKNFTLATCCNPIPGDEVIGYINLNKSVIVHRKNCPNLINLAATQGDRIMSVQWKTQRLMSFPVRINILGIDQLGIVNRITQVISAEANVNMKELNFDTNDGVFNGNIKLFVHSKNDLEDLITKIIKINGVKQVIRVEENE